MFYNIISIFAALIGTIIIRTCECDFILNIDDNHCAEINSNITAAQWKCSFKHFERLSYETTSLKFNHIPTPPLELQFEDSHIASLPRGIFDQGQLKIIVFNASNCGMKEFDPLALSNAKQLTSLILNGNLINNIKKFWFVGASELIRLELSNNLIENVEPGSFSPIKKLRILNLSQNKLKNIDGLLDSLPLLLTFKAGGNEIGSISQNIFDGNEELASIDLSYNKLIQFDSVIPPKTTTLLNLDYNPGLRKIKTNLPMLVFSAKNCNISELHINESNCNVGKIDLSSNRIESFSMMSNCNNVISLNMSGNAIKSFAGAFMNMASLKILSLKNCTIKELPADFLSNNKEIEKLDLSHNELTNLDLSSFLMLTKLRQLYIQDNKLTTLDVTDVQIELPHLSSIDFSGNKFSCPVLNNITRVLIQANISIVVNDHKTDVANVMGMRCNLTGQVDGSFGNSSRLLNHFEGVHLSLLRVLLDQHPEWQFSQLDLEIVQVLAKHFQDKVFLSATQQMNADLVNKLANFTPAASFSNTTDEKCVNKLTKLDDKIEKRFDKMDKIENNIHSIKISILVVASFIVFVLFIVALIILLKYRQATRNNYSHPSIPAQELL